MCHCQILDRLPSAETGRGLYTLRIECSRSADQRPNPKRNKHVLSNLVFVIVDVCRRCR